MASRKDIEAGAAYIRLYVKNSQLLSGLQSMGRQIADFATKATVAAAGFGIAAAGVAVAAVKSFARSGDEVNKMADRTGASVEALSELRYAIGQSGGSVEDLETGLTRMNKTIAEARDGSQSARDALRDLSLTAESLGESPERQLEIFAERISAIQDPAKRTALTMQVFGKSGTSLLPLFANGAKGIRELREEAASLGLTIDKQMADDATALGDAWDRVTSAVSGAAIRLGGALAPAITSVADGLTAGGKALHEWLSVNEDLIATVGRVVQALFSPGEWGKWGQIAVTSASVAILDGLAAMGDTVGTIANKVFLGDMSGAWDTAVLGMTATWDDFVAGVADAAAAMANAVVNVWQQIATSISQFIVDNQQKLKAFIDFASQVSGGKLFEKLAGVNIADQLLGPDIAPGDVATARDVAAGQISGQAAGLRASIEARRRSASERAVASAAAFSADTAGGSSRLSELAAAQREELSRLVGDVAASVAASRAGPAREVEAGSPIGSPRGPATLGTFSAAAAAALGGGSSTQERIARSSEKSERKLDKIAEASTATVAAVNSLAGNLRFS